MMVVVSSVMGIGMAMMAIIRIIQPSLTIHCTRSSVSSTFDTRPLSCQRNANEEQDNKYEEEEYYA
jgi:hypothetical protein